MQIKNHIKITYNYWRMHGVKLTLKAIVSKIKTLGKSKISTGSNSSNDSSVSSNAIPIKALLDSHFLSCTPLPVFSIPNTGHTRITIIIENLNSPHFTNTNAALIFSAILAEATQSNLRILTRISPAQPNIIDLLLNSAGIKLSREIEFLFSPPLQNKEISFYKNELFITTSWATTAAALNSVPQDLIVYFLHEDERLNYPYDDHYLRCEETLKNENIRFIVSTPSLYEYLITHGLPHIANQGFCLEPAFPPNTFYFQKKPATKKLRFLLYSCPNEPQSFFYLGIELIEYAISMGILDLSTWDIVLIGKNTPNITFSENYAPIKIEDLSWLYYPEIMRGIDLGLCLQHPEYPNITSLDLAACGAVVITNTDLKNHSKNILCTELNKTSLINTIEQGLNLAANTEARLKNYHENALTADWRLSLSTLVKQFMETS